MRLKALDQVHISSVKPDSLRPGEEFDVSDDAGSEILKAHPTKFSQVDDPKAKAEAAPKNKAEDPPSNKVAEKPANKSEPEAAEKLIAGKAPAKQAGKSPRTKRGK